MMCPPMDGSLHLPLCLSIHFVPLLGLFLLAGWLSLSPIHMIFNLCMILLYSGVLSKAFLSIFGEWYCLSCKLWGIACHLLWQTCKLSIPIILKVPSKCRMGFSWAAIYLKANSGSEEMRFWLLMIALGLNSSIMIYKGSFYPFSSPSSLFHPLYPHGSTRRLIP